jgi:fructose-bisphosphate aldolase class I
MSTKSHPLESIARQLVAPGRGILAADESSGTIKKRFDSIALESTAESRRAYRDLLFTAPGVEQFLSGVILYEETLRQNATNGRPFPQVLAERGILPGIKVDLGAKPLAVAPTRRSPKASTGCASAAPSTAAGRAVHQVARGDRHRRGQGHPERLRDRRQRARAGALCRDRVEQDLVPIVEPEVLMDGAHIDRRLLRRHRAHAALGVRPTGAPARAARGDPAQAQHGDPGQEAREAGRPAASRRGDRPLLPSHVPAAVPGIVFLSAARAKRKRPRISTPSTAWVVSTTRPVLMFSAPRTTHCSPGQVSFSYGRALQASALQAWKGNPANVAAAQRAFHHRARLTSAARDGRYEAKMEKMVVGA